MKNAWPEVGAGCKTPKSLGETIEFGPVLGKALNRYNLCLLGWSRHDGSDVSGLIRNLLFE
jgi:hypothetical protein